MKSQGLNRLSNWQRKRSIPTIRYEKQVTRHHVQVDVKFLDFKTEEGHTVRVFPIQAIDDATRNRAPKIYERHAQQNAIDFVDNSLPSSRSGSILFAPITATEDAGIPHAYIKSRTPRLNGKVERSNGTGQREFYRLLTYKDDGDLHAKRAERETFYNYHRPYGGLGGKTPYERLVEKM